MHETDMRSRWLCHCSVQQCPTHSPFTRATSYDGKHSHALSCLMGHFLPPHSRRQLSLLESSCRACMRIAYTGGLSKPMIAPEGASRESDCRQAGGLCGAQLHALPHGPLGAGVQQVPFLTAFLAPWNNHSILDSASPASPANTLWHCAIIKLKRPIR